MSDKRNANCHEIAAENERRVLHMIARFGGLTTRQLGRLLWPDCSAGMRMAQRTCARLLERHSIIRRGLPNGGAVYVLGQRGAAQLRHLGIRDVSARGHRDLRFRKPVHRLICNEVAIDYALQGAKIWTEFEVQHGLAPVPEIVCNKAPKIPDLVARTRAGTIWFEVENSFKSQQRLLELAYVSSILLDDRCRRPLGVRPHPEEWCAMEFVSPDAKRLATVARAFDRAITAEALDPEIARHVYLRLARLSPGLVWKGLHRRLSVEKFRAGMKADLERQNQLAELFDGHPLDPSLLDVEGLVYYLTGVLETIGFDLNLFSEEFGCAVTSYDHLRELITKSSHRLRRKGTEELIRAAGELLEENIDFNSSYMRRVIGVERSAITHALETLGLR